MDVSPKMRGTVPSEVTLVDSDPQSWPEQQDVKHSPGDLSGQESAPVGNLGEQDWHGHPAPLLVPVPCWGSCRGHPCPPRGRPGAIGGHRAPSRGQGAPGERSARPRGPGTRTRTGRGHLGQPSPRHTRECQRGSAA